MGVLQPDSTLHPLLSQTTRFTICFKIICHKFNHTSVKEREANCNLAHCFCSFLEHYLFLHLIPKIKKV